VTVPFFPAPTAGSKMFHADGEVGVARAAAGRGSGFRVLGLGFRVLGSGYMIQGKSIRVQDVTLRVQDSGLRVENVGFGMWG